MTRAIEPVARPVGLFRSSGARSGTKSRSFCSGPHHCRVGRSVKLQPANTGRRAGGLPSSPACLSACEKRIGETKKKALNCRERVHDNDDKYEKAKREKKIPEAPKWEL